MSIAELIMQGTNRSSENTGVLVKRLQQLGENVGAALAQKEQQKQAQEMLPFLQQSMQESMTLAGSGKTGEAYAKLMPFLTDPSVINNPNLLPAVNAALKLNELATNNFFKKEQLRVREDMYNARYGGGKGGGFEVPSFEEMDDSTSLVEANQPKTIDTTVGGYYDIIEEQNADNLPKDQPRRFAAGLRDEQTPFSFGMETGNASLYVADEETKNKAASAIQEYKTYTPDQKSEVIGKIVDTSNQPPENNIRVDIPGFGQGFITGPSMERAQVVTGVKRKQKFSQKSGLEREEEKTYGEKEKTQDQLAFEGFAQNIGVASAMFKQNKQLRDIMEMAGGDITQITTDDDFVEDVNGKQVPVKRVFVKGQDAGILSIEKPMGADGKPDPRRLSEAEAVETIIGAPGLIEQFGWKFYPQQGEKPTAAEAPAPAERFPVKPTAKTEAGAAAPAAQGLTLEQQVQQELSGAKQTGRTVTPQQAKAVEQSRIASQKSNLEAEKRRLENLIYTVQRASGKKTLKAGITKETEAKVKAELDKINNQLASF